MAKYNLVNNLKTIANNDYTIRGTNATLNLKYDTSWS